MLRRIYNKYQMEHPKLSEDIILAISVKSMNDPAGPNGLVPALLALRAFPNTVEIPVNYPNQREIAIVLHIPKPTFNQAVETSRNKNPLKASEYRFQPLTHVVVYGEGPKYLAGPHLVVHCEKKRVLFDL